MIIKCASLEEALNKQPDERNIWINGPEFYAYTGDDRIVKDEYPVIEIEAWQAVLALEEAGILQTVQGIIATQSFEIQTRWNRQNNFQSDNALVKQVLSAVGLSDQQQYDLFLVAQQKE